MLKIPFLRIESSLSLQDQPESTVEMVQLHLRSFNCTTVWDLPLYSFYLTYIVKKAKIPRILKLPLCWNTPVRCIAASARSAAAAATHPWNPCQHRAVSLSRFWLPQLPVSAVLAVFVLVLRLRFPSLGGVRSTRRPPPTGPAERRQPCCRSRLTPRRHSSGWGFALGRSRVFLLFPTLLEFNTSLFTGPSVAAAVALSVSFLSLFFFSLSLSPQHTTFTRLSFKQPLKA